MGRQDKRPAVVGVTGGALGLSALAFAFGVCCVAPWAVTLLGVAGAVLLARLAFFQPYVVAATIFLLGVGFWIAYRGPRTAVACDVAQQRRLRRLVWSAAIMVIAIDAASFAPRFLGGNPKAASQIESPPQAMVLTPVDQPLRDDFNRDQGFVRLMLLVDPRCPECLRGLADLGDDVLAKLPTGARIKVYVVHEPVIGGDEKDIPAAAELLHTTLARHYWNPTGDFGRQMSQVLGLLHGSRPVYAWDIYMIYPPGAVWSGQDPPQPAYLMHQLPGLDNQKFPPWDGKVFAANVNATLAARDRKAAAQATASKANQ